MTRRTLLASAVLAGLASACGDALPPTSPGPIAPPPDPIPNPPAPPPPPPPPRLGISRILSFGDSMTAGTTSPVFTAFALTPGLTQSYPFKLQTLLTARYSGQMTGVANAGDAGESVARGRERIGGVLLEATPELVILMEGANDLNSLNIAGLNDITLVVRAIEDMVAAAAGRGAQVMLATLPPQRSGSQRGAAGPLLPRFNNDMRNVAARRGAMLIDVNALLPLSAIGQDGLHPSEAGYQMLAEIFFDAIKGKYEVATSAP